MIKPAFIDLSHHNVIPESLEDAARSGIAGVIHKTTEGNSYVDKKMDSRFFLANQAGLLWGMYHFIRPGVVEDQVKHFLDAGETYCDRETLWCLDWEDGEVTLDDAIEFLERLEQATERVPVLYSGHVLKEALQGKPNLRISRYRLWLAQYAPQPVLPPGWDKYWGWQYTDHGTCPGVTPPTDLNAFDGTADELIESWSGESTEQEEAVVVTVTAPEGVEVIVKKGEVS